MPDNKGKCNFFQCLDFKQMNVRIISFVKIIVSICILKIKQSYIIWKYSNTQIYSLNQVKNFKKKTSILENKEAHAQKILCILEDIFLFNLTNTYTPCSVSHKKWYWFLLNRPQGRFSLVVAMSVVLFVPIVGKLSGSRGEVCHCGRCCCPKQNFGPPPKRIVGQKWPPYKKMLDPLQKKVVNQKKKEFGPAKI